MPGKREAGLWTPETQVPKGVDYPVPWFGPSLCEDSVGWGRLRGVCEPEKQGDVEPRKIPAPVAEIRGNTRPRPRGSASSPAPGTPAAFLNGKGAKGQWLFRQI